MAPSLVMMIISMTLAVTLLAAPMPNFIDMLSSTILAMIGKLPCAQKTLSYWVTTAHPIAPCHSWLVTIVLLRPLTLISIYLANFLTFVIKTIAPTAQLVSIWNRVYASI